MPDNDRSPAHTILDHITSLLIIGATAYAAWWFADLGATFDRSQHLVSGPTISMLITVIGKVVYHLSSMAQNLDLAAGMTLLFTVVAIVTAALAFVEQTQPTKGMLATMSAMLAGIGIGGLVGRRMREGTGASHEKNTGGSIE